MANKQLICDVCGNEFTSIRANNTTCRNKQCQREHKRRLDKELRKGYLIQRKENRKIAKLESLELERKEEEKRREELENIPIEKKHVIPESVFTDEQKAASTELYKLSVLAYNKVMPYVISGDFEELELRVFPFIELWLHGEHRTAAKKCAEIIATRSEVPKTPQDIKYYSRQGE